MSSRTGHRRKSAVSKKTTWHVTRPSTSREDDGEGENVAFGSQSRSRRTVAKDHDEHIAKRRKVFSGLANVKAALSNAEPDPAHADDDHWSDDEGGPVEWDPAGDFAASQQASGTVYTPGMGFAGFLQSSVPIQVRVDQRTRAEQMEREHEAWTALMPALVEAYLVSTHAEPTHAPPPGHVHAENLPQGPEELFTVTAVRELDYVHQHRVLRRPGEPAAVALMRVGLLACTPSQPSVAISVGLLNFYYCLRRRHPRLGIQPFARALCDHFARQYRPHLREQVTSAFDVFLAIRREVQQRVKIALGHDGPHYRALNSCACCNYVLEGEPALRWAAFTAQDGGQSARRSAAAGLADPRTLESEYFVDAKQVDVYENEVKRRVKAPKKPKGRGKGAWTVVQESGEPGDDALEPTVCAERWKNAKAEHFKIALGMFDQTGVFVSLCRHGFIHWLAEMIRSGELAKYPLAIIARMLEAGMRDRRNAYDIGCAFQGTLDRSELLGARAREAGLDYGLNSFHGYGHNRLCQLKAHPLYQLGFGLEDLETCERFFSQFNAVAPLIRHASHFHYVQSIDMFLQQWDQDKHEDMSKFICGNVVQAKTLIADLDYVVTKYMADNHLDDAHVIAWNTEEHAYLSGLKSEPAQAVLEISYVELLGDLASAELVMRSRLHDFEKGLRPLSAKEIDDGDLSPDAVKKLNKQRRDAWKKYTTTEDAVVALEAALRIDDRWTPESPQYGAALVKAGERDWRKALDKLELLMVQRMFELAKTHAVGTGYKMRVAIGKNLKSRSQAIRTAVNKYNAAAAKLVPAAAKVDFTQLLEWTELQEFELLRHSRTGDVREKDWANPANRVIAVKFHKLARAREELVRCKVEMQRLVTAMRDEEQHMQLVHDQLLESGSALAPEVRRMMLRRMLVNDNHRYRFVKLVKRYPDLGAYNVPGTRLGTPPVAPGPAVVPLSREILPDDIDDIDDELELDEELQNDITAVEDFLVDLE